MTLRAGRTTEAHASTFGALMHSDFRGVAAETSLAERLPADHALQCARARQDRELGEVAQGHESDSTLDGVGGRNAHDPASRRFEVRETQLDRGFLAHTFISPDALELSAR
jgi:hypothetical protein